MTAPPSPELPYHDTKPKGAADFYLAINATFRFMENRLGMEGLRRYWSDLGRTYYAPVAQRWQLGGLPAMAQYWRSFFDAEPGSDVTVEQHEQEVRVEVRTCPAIAHLRTHQREIVSCFCQHCYFVSEAMAAPAGFTVRVTGGNGACVQQFMPVNRADVKPQNLEDITRAS
ncbi:MAG: hypothetical protein ACAI34_19085 [Verrucomicrobium sp.]